MSAPGTQPEASSIDLLRSIAHELRQPLSTIESIAYYLSLVLPRDGEKVQEQLAQLQHLVEQSNWILTSGLQITDPAPVSPELIDLEELITQTASSRPAAAEVPVRLELAGNMPLVRVDPGLGRALIENVLMLFRQIATETHPVTLRTCAGPERGVSLEITSTATGYRSEATLGAGSALSLRSARGIVEAHGGSLDCSVDPFSGVRLCLHLP
jgi:signal transduction histidine kinase